MEETRDLRSFVIFRAEPTLFTQEPLVRAIERLGATGSPQPIGQERVLARVRSFEDGLLDAEILWETEDELPVARLTDSGQLELSTLRYRNATRIVTWFFEGTPYVFVFQSPRQSKLLTVLGELLQFTFRRVTFNNSFFHEVLNHPRTLMVREATFRSTGEGVQEFTVSGPRPESQEEDEFKRYFGAANVHDLMVVVKGLVHRPSFTVRFSHYGRVAILNTLDEREIRLFAQDVQRLLVEEGGALGEE